MDKMVQLSWISAVLAYKHNIGMRQSLASVLPLQGSS